MSYKHILAVLSAAHFSLCLNAQGYEYTIRDNAFDYYSRDSYETTLKNYSYKAKRFDVFVDNLYYSLEPDPIQKPSAELLTRIPIKSHEPQGGKSSEGSGRLSWTQAFTTSKTLVSVDDCLKELAEEPGDSLRGARLHKDENGLYSFQLWKVNVGETWQLTLPMRKIDD